jgi:hypothetical protein
LLTNMGHSPAMAIAKTIAGSQRRKTRIRSIGKTSCVLAQRPSMDVVSNSYGEAAASGRSGLEFAGRPAEAIESLEFVLRLEPRYQSPAMVLADLSLCHLTMGASEQAAGFARRVLEEAGVPRVRDRWVGGSSSLVSADQVGSSRKALAGTGWEPLLGLEPVHRLERTPYQLAWEQ